MLIAAQVDWPYRYYIFLRWVVFVAGASTAYEAYTRKRTWATWLFGLVALLYNPFLLLPLGRDLWKLIHCLTTLFFVAGMILLAERPRGSK